MGDGPCARARRSSLARAVLVLSALACGPTLPTAAPPCGPNVSRPDCYRGSRVPIQCDPRKWIDDAVERSALLSKCEKGEGPFIAEVDGTSDATNAQLEAFIRDADFFSIAGVARVRRHRCCWYGPRSGDCLTLEVQRCKTPLDEIVLRVQSMARAHPQLTNRRFDIALSVRGSQRPRCSRDDPSCLPLPYGAKDPPHYDPNASRIYDDQPERILEGECAHDGDCHVAGCGGLCASWIWQTGAMTCEGKPHLHESFCGCVQGRCRWFEQ